MRGYAILTSPRSGSTFLCSLLRNTGLLGVPYEWLNRIHFNKIVQSGAKVAEPDGLVAQASTANGVFGVKVLPWHFESPVTAPLAPFVLGQQLVVLRRRDLLGQAISRIRGEQTQQWTSLEVAEGEPAYDRARIELSIKASVSDIATWDAFLARTGRSALQLDYEDLAEDPQAAVEAIADLVGVNLGGRRPTSNLSIQRDALSEDWRARFLAEQEGRMTLDRIWQSDKWNRLGDRVVPVLKRLRRPFG